MSLADPLRVAMLAPVAWRTPPRHYGPWERVTSLLTEGLVARGVDVTLFATGDSVTSGNLHAVIPRGYEEDPEVDPKVVEGLHIAALFEQAGNFDIIHNQFDFLPLTYSRLVETPVVTTIHGFSSERIKPVYYKYNGDVAYISISNADRDAALDYVSTIYHGIDIEHFTLNKAKGEYLLFFGRIHPDKGAADAIAIARESGMKLKMAGIIQDEEYYRQKVEPFVDGHHVEYLGSVGPGIRDQLLGGASALLHPIYFDEPFGLSVVESMACGTPVIAYDRGSMPELITDGVNGFLVRGPEEAVEAVKKLSGIERAACRNVVEERFTVERMVEDYLAAYRTILNSRKEQ